MIVGIDLGTSTSEIAYINQSNQPEVIPNHLGGLITPSVVYINENNEPVVGLEAKEKLLLEPENTFMEVKRLMGQNKTLTARGKDYTPVEISSFILRYLTGCAEKYLHETIDKVVITVPAYFTDAQRRDTLQAGEMAGLTVERIINEPTAAALDYGSGHLEDCKNILVYDLGGGTLDVTVLELFEGVVDVKSTCGNNELGGKDFDEALVHFLTRDIPDQSGNLRALSRLKTVAEACKIALSAEPSYDVALPFLYNDKGKPAGLEKTVTRKEFEPLILDKISSSAAQIKNALYDADLQANDMDLVLLVGGSTKIPLVSDFLTETLDFDPQSFVDPDLAVVRGAAIQAGIMEGLFADNPIVLTDVCPYSLSTDVIMSSLFGEMLRCDILIPRNTTIPATESKVYVTSHDDQTSVDLSAFQGESTLPEDNILLNKFRLGGVPKARAGKEKIKVIFTYDLNAVLTVTGEVVSTGKSATIQINTATTGRNLDLSQWTDAKPARKYRAMIHRAEQMLESDALDPLDRDDIDRALTELKEGLILGWDAEMLDDCKEFLMSLLRHAETEME